MYEVEIEYPDGSKLTFNSFTLEVLFDSLESGEILSFTIRLRSKDKIKNPFRKKP